MGDRVKSHFQRLATQYDVIGDVRGLGAMVAMELVTDRETKEPATELTGKIATAALNDGAIFPTAGLQGNVLRVLVSLVITDEQIDEGMRILEAAFESALR